MFMSRKQFLKSVYTKTLQNVPPGPTRPYQARGFAPAGDGLNMIFDLKINISRFGIAMNDLRLSSDGEAPQAS